MASWKMGGQQRLWLRVGAGIRKQPLSPVHAGCLLLRKLNAGSQECFITFLCTSYWLTQKSQLCLETITFFKVVKCSETLATGMRPHWTFKQALSISSSWQLGPSETWWLFAHLPHFTQGGFSHGFSILPPIDLFRV